MLEELLYRIDPTPIVLFLLSAVGGAVVVWYRKKFREWAAFWRSVLDGLRGIPELQRDVKGIRYYVAPNGGGSLMDSAKRTEAAVGTLTEQVDMLAHTMLAEN